MDPTSPERLERATEVLRGLPREARREELEKLWKRDPELARKVARELCMDLGTEGFAAEVPPTTAAKGSPWGGRASLWGPTGAAPQEAETRIGPWKLLEEIGEGGMGRVFRAERADGVYRRVVAVKILHQGVVDPRREQRFRSEQRILAGLEHPGIARLYDAGVTNQGQSWIAMELVEGDDIVDHCERRELGVEARVRLMERVCRAASYAHAQGVVHRDLKPSNILVAEEEEGDGRPVVLDFGIARAVGEPGATRTGHLVGTPGYIAPEQVAGGASSVDRRADVFALGVILYQLLTGRRPFSAASAQEEMLRLLAGEPDHPRQWAPRLPRDLVTIILGCLERDPDGRYPSATAVAEDLVRFLEGMPPARRPVGPLGRVARRARRHPRIAVALAVAALAVVALSVRVYRVSVEAEGRARLAQRFGAEAERISAQMRIAHLSPTHDIRLHRQRLGAQLDELASEMERQGRPARAPGLLALGRGHLALGDLATAQRHLEASLAEGDRAPEVVLTLVEVLARAYWQARGEAEPITATEERAARKEAIDRELRDPALALLREVEGGAPMPQLLRAHAAAFEDQLEEALARAEAARREAPWLYETWVLEGDIHFGRFFLGARRRGQPVPVETLEKARMAFERAAAVGSSDPRSWEGLCQVAVLRLEMGLFERGAPLGPLFEEIEHACGQALTVDPERVTSLNLRSRARSHWARSLLRAGEDPAPTLAAAREDAERAIALDPTAVVPLRSLADALIAKADAALEQGGAVGSEIDEAIALLERAGALAPEHAGVWNSLGLAWWSRLEEVRRAGGDPLSPLEAGITAFSRARDLRPRYSHALSNLGALLRQRMALEIERGLDPQGSFQEAQESFRLALEANPGNSFAMNNLANLHREYGKWRMQEGEDPRPELREALALLARAVEVNPRWSSPWVNAGIAHVELALALHVLEEGDPASHFDAAEEAFRRANELRPGFPAGLVAHTEALLHRAAWEVASGLNASRTVASARALLEEVRSLAPEEPALVELTGRLAALGSP